MIQATTAAGFETALKMGEHVMTADEPVSAGGTDRGPTPYDLLGAALASCKTMTLRYYANREKLPLESAEATVAHERIHTKDCAECLSENAYVHRFVVTIRLTGPLSAGQRAKLLEVAGRCPVAKTLKNEIVVVDRLEEN